MPAEAAKAVVRRYFEAYNTQRPEAVMAFVHRDHIYHPPGGGTPMDRRGRQADEAPFFAAFTDIESLVEDQIAEGDRVATRVTMRCTHSGTYGGIPPTGRRIGIPFIDISIVRDGQIYEEWDEVDMRGILRQLQATR
jgi:steroid delta-isomerase-like uncharacterized protein